MLESIPTFLAALDTGSIQGAARQLAISRPTVRRRLQLLEDQVGVSLLQRESGILRPTAAGKVFAARARAMMEELEALGRAARETGATPRGVLRVGLPPGTPSQVHAGMTASVRAIWPNVTLVLVSSSSDEDLGQTVDCRFSLALDPPAGSVVTVDLGTVRESLVASRGYLEQHEPITTINDLADHPIFAWVTPEGGPPEQLPVVSGRAPKLAAAMATDDLHSLIWMANKGAGLSFVPFEPALARRPDFGAESLVTVLADVVGRERPRRLVAAKSVADMPVVAAFLEQSRLVSQTMFSNEGLGGPRRDPSDGISENGDESPDILE